MFVILWEYEVKTGSAESFERVYGPQGPWVELFGRDPRYLSTQLLRHPSRSSWYFTLDFWDSETAYQDVKRAYRAAYNSIDVETAGLTITERHISSFEMRPGASLAAS